jgi:hypothetical protein
MSDLQEAIDQLYSDWQAKAWKLSPEEHEEYKREIEALELFGSRDCE